MLPGLAEHSRRIPPPPPGGARLGQVARLCALFVLGAALASCGSDTRVEDLSRRAKVLWERGQYEDAARAFVAVTEVDPRSALAEESTFWAGCLFQYYLNDPSQATRYYRLLELRFPDGEYVNWAKQNLAEIYERDPNTVYRALQIDRQLLQAKELSDSYEKIQLKIALLNLQLGRMDQARFELRTFLRKYPHSRDRAQAYYLVGFSYYLQRRTLVAMSVMQQTAKDFPDTPIAAQAQFFLADTKEEQGNLQDALKLFQGLTGKYHDPKIVEKRIQTLEARIRRGVR